MQAPDCKIVHHIKTPLEQPALLLLPHRVFLRGCDLLPLFER